MFESFRSTTQGPPDDDPFDKPLEVKTLNLKKSLGLDLKYVGCVTTNKRNDGNADITLTFNGENFLAHKYVLWAQSERFKWEAAFQPQSTPGKKRKRPVKKVNTMYNLNDILPEDFPHSVIDQAINFMYTGLLPLFPDKGFLDFFAIAVAFELNMALQIYRKYLAPIYDHPHHILTNHMVAFIMSQCQKINKPPALSACAEELLCIFVDVCTYLKFTKKETVCSLAKDVDFLKHLSPEAAVKFLGREDIAKDAGELQVLKFALAWLKYDDENRKKYSKDLLQEIHLGVLSRDDLIELVQDKTVTGCKEMIFEVFRLMNSDEGSTGQLQITQPGLFAERGTLPIKTLVGIGPGLGGRRCLFYFNAHGPKHTQGWRDWCDFQPIPDRDFPLYDASVLEVNGKLYVAGGCDNTYRKHHSYLQPFGWFPPPCSGKWTTNTFYKGNLGVNTLQNTDTKETLTLSIVNPWSMLMPMKKHRRMFPMVHLDGYLYAIGGQDDSNQAMKDVERYSFDQKEWQALADLPVPCYYACATAYKGKILVYGSQPVPNEETPAQHNLQMYNPHTNKWTNLLTEYYKIAKFMMEEDGPAPEVNMEEESEEETKEIVKNEQKEGPNGGKEDDPAPEVNMEEESKEETKEIVKNERKEGPNGGKDCDRASEVNMEEESEEETEEIVKNEQKEGPNGGKEDDPAPEVNMEEESKEETKEIVKNERKEGPNGGKDGEEKEVKKEERSVVFDIQNIQCENSEVKVVKKVSETQYEIQVSLGLNVEYNYGKEENDDDDDSNDDDDDDDDDEWSDCDSEGVSFQDRLKEKREIGPMQPRNAIVVDGDNCYRLLYKAVKIKPRSKIYHAQPVVHQLELKLKGNKPSGKIGKPENQKLIPQTDEGAFQINNNVYVNVKGCVYKTGVKITPGQKKKVNPGPWRKLSDGQCAPGCFFEDLTVTNFLFDKKAVFCEKCLKGGNCCRDFADDDSLVEEDPSDHCNNLFNQYVNDRNMTMFGESFEKA